VTYELSDTRNRPLDRQPKERRRYVQHERRLPGPVTKLSFREIIFSHGNLDFSSC
jgi:hypothetical protein